MGMFFISASQAIAYIDLRNPENLKGTLATNNTVLQAIRDYGNPLEARGGLVYDRKTGELIRSPDVGNELIGDERVGAELVGDIPDKGDESARPSDGSANLNDENSKSLVPSGKNSSTGLPLSRGLSASNILSGSTSGFTSGKVLGLNPGSTTSVASSAATFLDANKYASITEKAIASNERNEGVASSLPDLNNLNNGGKTLQSLSTANPSPNLLGNDGSSLSDVTGGGSTIDIAGYNEAFPSSSYGSPMLGSGEVSLDGNKGQGNIPQGDAPKHSNTGNKSEDSSKKDTPIGEGNPPKDPSKDPIAKPENCQAAKELFYANFNNTSSYTEEKIVTDKDGKSRKQYCVKPQKNDLYDVYGALGNLEESCPQEIGALFYGSDAESACVWVDDPPSASGHKGNNLGDLFSKESVEGGSGKAEAGQTTIHNQRNITSGDGK
jgi:hypothetical protein